MTTASQSIAIPSIILFFSPNQQCQKSSISTRTCTRPPTWSVCHPPPQFPPFFPPFLPLTSHTPVLKSRTTVPYIRVFPPSPTARLIILPGEDDASTPSTSRGRPLGAEYFDISLKISFMDTHGIGISVISLANPWLDFLPPSEAAEAAAAINDDIDAMCNSYPGRLYAFATLPVSAGQEACVAEVRRLAGMRWVRGVVLGTGGMGSGMDDPRLDDVYTALGEMDLPVFLHPHYGLPAEAYGPRADEYGHVLPLAMG